jgi:hypothetical protein
MLWQQKLIDTFEIKVNWMTTTALHTDKEISRMNEEFLCKFWKSCHCWVQEENVSYSRRVLFRMRMCTLLWMSLELTLYNASKYVAQTLEEEIWEIHVWVWNSSQILIMFYVFHTMRYGKLIFLQTNKCTLAKMFRYTVLFITLTCFSHFCDHIQGVVQ